MGVECTVDRIVLRNGDQTAIFIQCDRYYRPEWFREGERPMLRFKDHEWLNISGIRVTAGALLEQTADACLFGGREILGSAPVEWSVRISLPADGQSGFTVSTRMVPIDEPVEVMEALTTFETPYEYDGQESVMTVIAQQPVYRMEKGTELNGAGYTIPIWYYGKKGAAHLTYPSSSPMLVNKLTTAEGSNTRFTMILGNWQVSSVKDLFAQPTRVLRNIADDLPFPDPTLQMTPGKRGMKFLVGAVNWNASLTKDPNVLVEPVCGLRQEVTVDYRGALAESLDAWLASGWERLAHTHFPAGGNVPAYQVAKTQDASWIAGAEWLSTQLIKPEGYPGFFTPEHGVNVYSPFTRPKWDHGVENFCGQWVGPLAYLGHAWHDEAMVEATDRLEEIFRRGSRPEQESQHTWTIGPTPMYVGVLRKAGIRALHPDTQQALCSYVTRRAEYVLNPPAGAQKGDGGILAWDAFCNLLAADHFNREACEAAAREMLVRFNAKLDSEFWQFNCAAEGDMVGAGQARPFGHGIAAAANMLAWQRFGDPGYLEAGKRFANLLLAMHYITYNESPSCDLDTRGWAQGSTGGRDQTAQLPPWETGYALQQFAYLAQSGMARAGIYDELWLFSHTGLAQFPAARIMKRLYRPDMSITYRPMAEIATERAYYRSLPYLAYENPWDQTMLAGYQGVEPLILSLFLGGGLAAAEDERVLALAPEAATYVPTIDRQFSINLWNPLPEPIETRLYATAACKRGTALSYTGPITGSVSPEQPFTDTLQVPSREVVTVTFRA